MKKIAIMTAVASMFVGAVVASPIEYWDMSDVAGTDLNDLSNSGSLGSTWNFNTADATDGSGNFVVDGGSGLFTRKLPAKGTANAQALADLYAAPITTGAYRLEINFSSWNVDAASSGDTLSFGVNDLAGNRIARIAFRAAGDVQFSNFDGGYRVSTINMVETGAQSYVIDFDFDNDTVEYLVNGGSIYSGAMTGTEIGGFIYSKGGTWGTAASSMSIDSMGLSVIPEPATLGLVTALGGALMFVRRRFMV